MSADQVSISPLRLEILRSLPIDAQGTGVQLTFDRSGLPYLPKPFLRGLEPEILLVTGIRGSGKSHLCRALQARQGKRAVLAFGGGVLGEQPGKDELKQLLATGYPPRLIWKAVVLRACTGNLELRGKSWSELSAWVSEHPSDATAVLDETERSLSLGEFPAYVLFDELEQVADSSRDRLALVRGLLELMLELRSLRKLRLKAFIHSDLVSAPEVNAFPGASKVLAAQTLLHWQAHDLYALLFGFLGNARSADFAADFRAHTELPWEHDGHLFVLPAKLADDTERQRRVFATLTGWTDGPHLFSEPYISLPVQLADAQGRISPGSFLLAIAFAAVHEELGPVRVKSQQHPPLSPAALLFGAVRAAKSWADVLLEEQPWAYQALNLLSLSGQSVPLKEAALLRVWRGGGFRPPRAEHDEREPAPTDFQDALEQLQRLGVVESLADGSINIPELYRVGFGLDRRGGFRLR